MKKYFITSIRASFTLIFIFTLSGCVKDSCHRTTTYIFYEPVYNSKANVKANIKSNSPAQIKYPGKIYILGNYIFLNDIDRGIHIIDNSNPSSPVKKAFINIPGNMDIAVKGNILYADLYSDLVTIDISDPLNAIVKKYNEGVFPFRSYGNGFSADQSKIVVDWIKKDTTVTEDCSGNLSWLSLRGGAVFMANASSDKATISPLGVGGSMARFTLVDNRMYTVSNNDLNIFNISTPENPLFNNKININAWNIETIFPFKDKLFIGSQNGMFIYNITNPDNPGKIGQFSHSRACDPVIADDNFAYVTLHSGTTCMGFENQLDVVQLNDLNNSKLVKTYNLTSPHGLSKDGNLLFICDGTDGLKIFDATDVMNLKLLKHIKGMETYDVITDNGIALVVTKDGLYQYNYKDVNNISFLSKIDILK
jgi:hypothetical protein